MLFIPESYNYIWYIREFYENSGSTPLSLTVIRPAVFCDPVSDPGVHGPRKRALLRRDGNEITRINVIQYSLLLLLKFPLYRFKLETFSFPDADICFWKILNTIKHFLLINLYSGMTWNPSFTDILVSNFILKFHMRVCLLLQKVILGILAIVPLTYYIGMAIIWWVHILSP